jgi:hypothetical protein
MSTQGRGKEYLSHKLAADERSSKINHAEFPLIRSSLLLEQISHSNSLSLQKIRSFPPNSICGPWTESSRIFAECFSKRPDGHAFKENIKDFANDLESFMDKFAAVFHRMITERNPTGHPALFSLGLANSTIIVNGAGVGNSTGNGGGRLPNGGGVPPNRNLRAEGV